MKTIVERLRKVGPCIHWPGEAHTRSCYVNPDGPEAADAITALSEDNARLTRALERVIEAAERALGDHIAPHDCFATGPCTGNPIADLIACPGCVQQNEIAAARTALQHEGGGREG